MKRSTVTVVLLLTGYLIVFSVVVSAIVKAYGSDSIAMYIAVIALGTIGLPLIATHEGLYRWLKKLDKE